MTEKNAKFDLLMKEEPKNSRKTGKAMVGHKLCLEL